MSSQTPSNNALPAWNLDDLYPAPDSPLLHNDLETIQQRAADFSRDYKGNLEKLTQTDTQKLGQSIKDYEHLSDLLGRVYSYAGLLYASDNSNPDYQKFYGDMQARLTEITTTLIFYELELNRIDEKLLHDAIERDQSLLHYRPWIEDLRRERPYQLDDRTEQLFHEKSQSGAAAWNRLYNETLSALRFDIDGEIYPLESSLTLLQDANRDKRKQAALALSKTFKSNLPLFTLITNTLAKDKEISDRWRGFQDIADSRHLSNRVEGEVVNALVNAVVEAYPQLSHRYYKMKADWLNLPHLEYWDRNAPLPQANTDPIDWQTAQHTVLEAYNGFSPKMAEIAQQFFDKNWIDAEHRDGKSSGAFAHPTTPSVHPYILLNYLGKPRDVMTLAHELGHGVHQVLAAKQGALMAPTPLTLAETASVFGEMLTFRSLLAKTTDKNQRKALLAQKTEDMLNTVVRQIAFYQFERAIHTERKQGELTSTRIGELWMQTQSESLGSAIRLGEGYETFWTYVPHFIHSPFYVYSYAFGDCLVNSLYAVYEAGQADFEKNYFDLLKAGGSKSYTQLLAPFGLNPHEPSFWQKGLSLISQMIDELEQLD